MRAETGVAESTSLANLRSRLLDQINRFTPSIPVDPELLVLAMNQMQDENGKHVIAHPEPGDLGFFDDESDARHNMQINTAAYKSIAQSMPYILFNTANIAELVRRHGRKLDQNMTMQPFTNNQAAKASLICAIGFMHAVFKKDDPLNVIGKDVVALSQTHRGIYQGLSRYVNSQNRHEAFNPDEFVKFTLYNDLVYESDGDSTQVCPASRRMMLNVASCFTSRIDIQKPEVTSLACGLGISDDLKLGIIEGFCSQLMHCKENWSVMNYPQKVKAATNVNMALGYI